MISFRYHIVSIVAVFLALALGIVVGTTALNGPITKDLRKQLNSAKKQRDSLAGQAKTLQGQVTNADTFASDYGAKLVAGQLTGRSVLQIVLPGSPDSMQSGVQTQLTNAGAKITGTVTLTNDYLDQSLSSGIVNLATGSAHPQGWTGPQTSNGGLIAGSLLAYVLTGVGQQPTDLTQVLSAFTALHMINVSSSIAAAPDVVIIGGGTPASSYGGSAELALADYLAQRSAHVVVTADLASAGKGGLISLVRNSSNDASKVSTVDDANSAFGQVSAALVLAAAAKGNVGHYGTGAGVDALFPAPSK